MEMSGKIERPLSGAASSQSRDIRETVGEKAV